MYKPERVTVDTSGVVYITDTGIVYWCCLITLLIFVVANNVVRYISTLGIIDAVATSIALNSPSGVVVDSNNGNIIVGDSSAKVYVMSVSSGVTSVFAGTGTYSTSGNGGRVTSAAFKYPDALYLDSSSKLFVSDRSANVVRVMYAPAPTSVPTVLPTSAPSSVRSSNNIIATFAGTGTAQSSGNGGKASSAGLSGPRGVWQDSTGVTYVSEGGASCIRKIDTNSIVSTYAGTSGSSGSTGDGGPATSGTLASNVAICGSTSGEIFTAEYAGNRVRKVSAAGIMITVIGTGSGVNSGDGGTPTSASIQGAYGLFVNSVSEIFVTSVSGHRVRKVSSGIISTIAGTGLWIAFLLCHLG